MSQTRKSKPRSAVAELNHTPLPWYIEETRDRGGRRGRCRFGKRVKLFPFRGGKVGVSAGAGRTTQAAQAVFYSQIEPGAATLWL